MSALLDSDALDRIVNSTESMRESIDRLAARTVPTVFTLRTPILKQGRTNMPLAATPHLWVQLKCYASGGENGLHAHPNEDHMFVILQGEALFYGPEGETCRVGRNQGIMMPAGALYRFHAEGADNLVLLRIGAGAKPGTDILARVDEQGRDFEGFAGHNAVHGAERAPTIVDEGRWFE